MPPQLKDPAKDLHTALFGSYYVTHERMIWSLGDIALDSVDSHQVDEETIEAVRATMLVESHNPVYASVLLKKLRFDFAATAFLAVWVYEESKHFLGLKGYLDAVGAGSSPEAVAELEATRAGEWSIPHYYTDLMVAAYTMMQEHVTGIFYRNFAQSVQEPVLRKLLSLIGKDEFRHHRFYFDYARRLLDKDPDRVAEIDTALLEFQMPGPSFIPNYQFHGLAMADAGNLGIATFQEAVGVLGKLIGDARIRELAADRSFRPQNSWLRHAIRNAAGLNNVDAARVERSEARRRELLQRARRASR